MWFEVDNDAAISGFAVLWHFMMVNEEDGVGARVSVADSAEFVGERSIPEDAYGFIAINEIFVL